MSYIYFAFALLCVIGAIRLSRQHKAAPGVITLPNGHKYVYVMGNNLPAEAVRFHGMDVQLPHALSDFYLDASKDVKHHGPNMLFAPGQTVELEGDFNKFFRLFVPANTQIGALSILAPDVMQTLMKSVSKYDVQLHKDHLRIISPKPVYGMDGYEIDLKWAAEALLPEIDHRLASWQPTDMAVELQYKRGKTLKIGGKYIRRGQLLVGLLAILATIVIVGFGLALYYTHLDPRFSDPYSKGRVPGILMSAAEWIVIGGAFVVPMSVLVWFMSHKRRVDEYLSALMGR